jgi:triosephosphate isomerase
MSQPPLIVGNWKMHGSRAESTSLAAAIARWVVSNHPRAEAVLCPPAILIPPVVETLKNTAVRVGGQDCHAEAKGAFTGQISASMLYEAGCSHVILGHSERRQQCGETDAQVRGKVEAALAAHLTPILCVGESERERDSGKAEAIVTAQLRASLPEDPEKAARCVIAYEPVWAIGTGRIPTAEQVEAMHLALHEALGGLGVAKPARRVLYGGSVRPENARAFLNIPGVGGLLIGGASLQAESFCAILHATVE